MSFLKFTDYDRLIQRDNLEQLFNNIEDGNALLQDIESSSIVEMSSYLLQRYDASTIFKQFNEFSLSTVYYAGDRIVYTEKDYDYNTQYILNDRFNYKDKIYKVINDSPLLPIGITPDDTTYSTYFQFICNNNSYFYIALPQQQYSTKLQYTKDTYVFYKDSVYLALQDNKCIKPGTNVKVWQFVYTFSFSGFYPDEEVITSPLLTPVLNNDYYFFKAGDTRNQLLIQYLIDIILYHLHARINPRNIPELRMIRYDGNNATQNGGAIAWLKRIASGDITIDLPENEKDVELSYSWGKITDNNSEY